MDGKLKGHAALWVANIIWGLNAPIGKSVLWSETHPQGVSPFALSVYRMLGACLLFWTVSLFLPREKVAPRDIVLLLFASVFGIQLNQMLFLWGLSLTSPIDTSIIATIAIYNVARFKDPVTIVILLSVSMAWSMVWGCFAYLVSANMKGWRGISIFVICYVFVSVVNQLLIAYSK